MTIKEPLQFAKETILDAYLVALTQLYGYEADAGMKDKLFGTISQPKHAQFGDLSIPCAIVAKQLKQKPNEVALQVQGWLNENLVNMEDAGRIFESTQVERIFLSFTYSFSFLGEVVGDIIEGDFLAPDDEKRDKVMIEYSQPNTHKVFHVGHMRNVALGNSLVRLYEYMGHETIPANYFGDEGAHVAKCLWRLNNYLQEAGVGLEELKFDDMGMSRGEWLGKQYVSACELLDMEAMTDLPFPGIYSARVLTKDPHPAEDAPDNWHVVTLLLDEDRGTTETVVCGGNAYEVGDVVAYLPVGGFMKKKEIISKDMKGVVSSGVMLSFKELNLTPPPLPEVKEPEAEVQNDQKKKKKKGKKKKKKPKLNMKAIYLLPRDAPVGIELVELGRHEDSGIPADQSISDVLNTRKTEVSQTLQLMEARDRDTIALWDETKAWSLQEFHRIYEWLDAPFEHEFFESEVADESKELVEKSLADGVLVESQGAIGANLEEFGLGFCILLKSDGTGLYATKDLALAHRKFTTFDVERSIYVVDASQSLHFKQVFKTLELMGYEHASKCFHLPYGQVRVPSGKMSSRKGNDIYFSALKQTLGQQIYDDYLIANDDWEQDEISGAQQALSVATIKYGMLNVDPAKDIVFEMEKWAAKSGNTGVYLMYGYTRTQSVLRKVPFPDDQVFDPSTLGKYEIERLVLIKLNEFWTAVSQSTYSYKPSFLCAYLYELTKMLMVLYESEKLKELDDLARKYTLLKLMQAIGETLKQGLYLLGIRTIERM